MAVDAGVGAARAVGVLDLPVAVGRRQRVEHAAPRFLDLVLEVGDGAEAVDQPLVHQLRVAMRAPLIAVLERRDHGGRRGRRRPRARPVCGASWTQARASTRLWDVSHGRSGLAHDQA